MTQIFQVLSASLAWISWTISATLCAVAILVVLTWLFSGPVLAQGLQPTVVAFTNANILPLAHEGVEQGRIVLVRGDRIAEVGSRSRIKVPSDAVVIDCTGRYLVPGLTDAHVHVPGSPVVRTRDDFGDGPIYLAYGAGVCVILTRRVSETSFKWLPGEPHPFKFIVMAANRANASGRSCFHATSR